MALCLAGITVRTELLGVTSIVRAPGLEPACYDRLLNFFHSQALELNKLTHTGCTLIFRIHHGIVSVNRRVVLVGDGLKVAKAGRKMPGVKKLHYESESNTKPEYIFGHSCQAIAVMTQALASVFTLPLACRIHKGTVFSNRDRRTLLDKMIMLLDSLGLLVPCYLVVDAYYANGKTVRGLRANGNHLVTRVRSNSVAFFPATVPPDRNSGGTLTTQAGDRGAHHTRTSAKEQFSLACGRTNRTQSFSQRCLPNTLMRWSISTFCIASVQTCAATIRMQVRLTANRLTSGRTKLWQLSALRTKARRT
jgi:hypothetical protein